MPHIAFNEVIFYFVYFLFKTLFFSILYIIY